MMTLFQRNSGIEVDSTIREYTDLNAELSKYTYLKTFRYP